MRSLFIRWWRGGGRIRRSRMNDGVLQDSSDLVHRPVLCFGDLAQGAFVRSLVRHSQSQIQNVRRYPVRVGHIANSHPAPDRLVLVVTPVDGIANSAEGVQAREAQDQ